MTSQHCSRSASGTIRVASSLILGFAMLFAADLGEVSLTRRGPQFRANPIRTQKSGVLLRKADRSTHARAIETYGKLPLSFEANQGQTDPRVKFMARGSGYTMFLTKDEGVLSLRHGALKKVTSSLALPGGHSGIAGRASFRTDVLQMKLAGANPRAKVIGLDELPDKSNYFVGNDPKKWTTNVPNYAKVRYKSVYPGIDLVYYGNQGQLEYDFVVAPGASPKVIALDVGAPLHIDPNGDLIVNTAGGDVLFYKPTVYQADRDGERHRVEAGYALERGQSKIQNRKSKIGFWVGAYDRTRPLVIDPALSYSTYLGGSRNETGYGISVDASGSAYVIGNTTSSDFPTTPGAFQGGCGGGKKDCHIGDVFVAKLNPTGSALAYSTYLGGSGNDGGNDIVVDASGDAYVSGLTASADFPTTPGAFQTACGGGCAGGTFDAFVTKLNSTGSALLYSTYVGGSSSEEADGLAVDASGNAYVTGFTQSSDFPTTPGVFQSTCGSSCQNGDAFLLKLNAAGSALTYSTYLGGSNLDYGLSVAVESSGDAYVTGATSSTDFPTTPGAFETACKACANAASDAFVTELNPTGSALVYSTYLGGSGNSKGALGDQGFGIAIDASGHAYVTGQTYSTDFPTTLGALQKRYGGGGDAFVTEVNPNGSQLVFSTYLGGKSHDNGLAIAVDSAGNVYVTGSTSSSTFPTTSDAFDTICHACVNHIGDAFVTELNPVSGTLVYSTFLGGRGNKQTRFGDQGHAIAVDTSGDIYVAGNADSVDFPTTPGAFQTTCGGGCSGNTSDAFVAKFGH